MFPNYNWGAGTTIVGNLKKHQSQFALYMELQEEWNHLNLYCSMGDVSAPLDPDLLSSLHFKVSSIYCAVYVKMLYLDIPGPPTTFSCLLSRPLPGSVQCSVFNGQWAVWYVVNSRNRPGIARAVQQSPLSLIVINWECLTPTMCHMSYVMFHVSHVRCQVSCVRCQV